MFRYVNAKIAFQVKKGDKCKMDNEAIVNSIKVLCKSINISASQLEKEVGLSQGLISKWQKTMPSLDKIIDIADYFHVSLDDVIGRRKGQQNEQEDFIPLLLQMTKSSEIIWKDNDYDGCPLPTERENFELFEEVDEIYYAKFSNGYFYLVAQYEELDVRLEDIDIQMYIQPDANSKPIPRTIEFDQANELWLLARKNTRGLPDAYKANDFISNFLKLSKKSE